MKDIRDYNFMILEQHKKENFKGLVSKLRHEGIRSGVATASNRLGELLDVNAANSDNFARGKRIRFNQGAFYFNLSTDFAMAILKSLSILSFILLIYLQFSNKIRAKGQLFQMQKQINILGMDTIVMQNFILANYLFDKSDLILYKKKAVEGLESFYQKTADMWFERVDLIF